MYKPIISLLAQYKQKVTEKQIVGFNANLVSELIEKMEQLDFLLESINVLQDQYCYLTYKNGNPIPASEYPELFERNPILNAVLPAIPFRIKLFAESFYYLSFRVITLFKKNSNRLPELRELRCNGITIVRNQLLEHPEGSGIFTWSSEFSQTKGPRMKPIRDVHEPKNLEDQGLYFNAEELKNELNSALKEALKKLTPV